MKLENGYVLVYTASAANGVRTIKASKTGIPADGDLDVSLTSAEEATKLIYADETAKALKYSTTGIPASNDSKLTHSDELFKVSNAE